MSQHDAQASTALATGKKKKLTPASFDWVALAGRGAFGKVWVVRLKEDYSGRVMALKVINKREIAEKEYVAHVLLEKDIMTMIRSHPFIVELYHTFQTSSSVYMVMEYLPGGSLLGYIQESPTAWPEETCRFYGAEILLALEFMHSLHIVYRDLKLENLLLDMDGHIRLSDFGLSARLRHSRDLVKSMSGTAGYLAPEILTDHEQGHGKSVDVWAFGVTMFILLLRESPFYSENLRELFDMVIHEDIHWEWYKRELSPSALDLLRGLLTKNPQRRLGCGDAGVAEIRRHPFFASVDWDEVYSMKQRPPIRPTLRIAERVSNEERKLQTQTSSFLPKLNPEGECRDTEFGGFSFVAADMTWGAGHSETNEESSTHTATDMDEEDEATQFAWPFAQGTLPGVVVVKIIQFLSVQDIAHASCVCRAWNNFIWTYLRHLDLTPLPAPVVLAHWASALVPWLGRPRSLRLLSLHGALGDEQVALLPPMATLETLELAGSSQLSAKGLRSLYQVQGGSHTHRKRERNATRQRPLEYSHVHFPALQVLTLSDCPHVGDDVLDALLPYRHLQQLSLANTAVTGATLQCLTQLEHLWRLDLQGLPHLKDAALEKLAGLSHLRVLELSGCTGLTAEGVEALRTRLPHLEVLTWDEMERAASEAKSASKAKRRRRKFGLMLRRKRTAGVDLSHTPLVPTPTHGASDSREPAPAPLSPERTPTRALLRLPDNLDLALRVRKKNRNKARSADYSQTSRTRNSVLHHTLDAVGERPAEEDARPWSQDDSGSRGRAGGEEPAPLEVPMRGSVNELHMRHRQRNRVVRRRSRSQLQASVDGLPSPFSMDVRSGVALESHTGKDYRLRQRMDVPSLLADLGRKRSDISSQDSGVFATAAMAAARTASQPLRNAPRQPQRMRKRTHKALSRSGTDQGPEDLVAERSQQLLSKSRSRALPSRSLMEARQARTHVDLLAYARSYEPEEPSSSLGEPEDDARGLLSPRSVTSSNPNSEAVLDSLWGEDREDGEEADEEEGEALAPREQERDDGGHPRGERRAPQQGEEEPGEEENELVDPSPRRAPPPPPQSDEDEGSAPPSRGPSSSSSSSSSHFTEEGALAHPREERGEAEALTPLGTLSLPVPLHPRKAKEASSPARAHVTTHKSKRLPPDQHTARPPLEGTPRPRREAHSGEEEETLHRGPLLPHLPEETPLDEPSAQPLPSPPSPEASHRGRARTVWMVEGLTPRQIQEDEAREAARSEERRLSVCECKELFEPVPVPPPHVVRHGRRPSLNDRNYRLKPPSSQEIQNRVSQFEASLNT